MRRFRAIGTCLLLAVAAPLAAQGASESETVLEVIGLERWTAEMIEDSIQRFAPGVTLRDAACAVILRDSMGFAQAAVTTSTFPQARYTIVSVVEPQSSERVAIRQYSDSLPDRSEWSGIRRILDEDPRALYPLQDYSFLVGATDSFFGEPVAAASIALRDEIRSVALARGDSVARWTLLHDHNRQNRALAALVLGHFAERESTWLTLMSALRGPSDSGTQLAIGTLAGMSRDATRPVDWSAIEDDLAYLLGGTNLFVYEDVIWVLTRTHVPRETAKRLIALDTPLLIDNLQSAHPGRRAAARRLVARATGADHGDDVARWVEVVRAAQAEARAARPAPSVDDPRVARAVEALRVHADTSGVAGLSAAIMVDGELVWSGGFGWSDVERRIAMTDSTVSRIGSISKPVATVATLLLVDRGRLDLDVPIATYLPDYPRPQGDVITTRQLLSHTAGIRHYRGAEFASDIRYDDVFAPLAVFAADSLLFEPGSRYSYSTYGFTVVSAVTAAADGRPWTELMRDEVFEPLALGSMQPEWADSVIPNLAGFYYLDDDSLVVAPRVDNSNKWAGGGLVADARDLVRFGQAMIDGRLLSDAARAEMWTQQTPADDESYGLGWRVGELAGHRAISHSGGSMGATAMLILLPDDDIVVGVLGNTSGVGHAGIAGRVARLMLESEIE